MKYLVLLLFFFSFLLPTKGQYAIGLIPRTSPDKGISQKIGFLDLEIKYGSPKVKGRRIWGELVPWNEVWRAGANNATTIQFSHEVLIGKEILSAGTYALFVIPKNEASWTIIFSKKAKQWGAFSYQPADDALRLEVNPKSIAMQEELEYRILQKDQSQGVIALVWEKQKLEIPFSVDYIDLFIQHVEKTAGERKGSVEKAVVFLQGAEYLVKEKQQEDLVAQWLTKSSAFLEGYAGDWNPQYYPRHYIRGHQQWIWACAAAQAGDHKKAIKLVKALQKEKEKYSYYSKKKEKLDSMLAKWMEL